MVPVSMFIDGVSIWLAYYVWTLVPTASGQESSTRYIKISAGALGGAGDLGIPDHLAAEWQEGMEAAFSAYARALAVWENVAAVAPGVARIPAELLADSSPAAMRAV